MKSIRLRLREEIREDRRRKGLKLVWTRTSSSKPWSRILRFGPSCWTPAIDSLFQSMRWKRLRGTSPRSRRNQVSRKERSDWRWACYWPTCKSFRRRISWQNGASEEIMGSIYRGDVPSIAASLNSSYDGIWIKEICLITMEFVTKSVRISKF